MQSYAYTGRPARKQVRREYEELHDQDKSRLPQIRDLVDGLGSETGLGYYVD